MDNDIYSNNIIVHLSLCIDNIYIYIHGKHLGTSQVYSGKVPNFLVWNDQFYGASWAHA